MIRQLFGSDGQTPSKRRLGFAPHVEPRHAEAKREDSRSDPWRDIPMSLDILVVEVLSKTPIRNKYDTLEIARPVLNPEAQRTPLMPDRAIAVFYQCDNHTQ